MVKKKGTILIIEDETALRKALANKLSKEGFIILEGLDGEDGLAKAIESKPDLILLDIVMPKKDGMTVLEELRKDSWGKNAQVMFLTNLSDPHKEEEAKKFNVEHFLVKTDWSLEDLLKRIQTILK
ncbi:hypothetical protein C0581_02455 [Candidatus Parcubacteria bacterium]|nr:MAG: hypothetical protein C0581_02455 [Candidatus Parcubacteria bacterium]